MQRMTPIALALSLSWGVCPLLAMAQSATGDEASPTQLKAVSVTSTRTERALNNVPNVVTVVTQEQMQQQGARNIKDVLDDEIDLSVRAGPARFNGTTSATGRTGNESINIRGLEGNQVLMLEDGIRVPNSFSFSAFSTGRGDYLELDGLKSVEVLRGPASTQYGSDGLAGVVSFRTLDPSDLLKKGQDSGGFARLGYASVDRSTAGTLAYAGRKEQWQYLLLGGYRQGHELKNKGDNDSMGASRTTPNPADYDSSYLLGKAILTIDGAHQLGFTAETQHRKQDTELYTARGLNPYGWTTLDMTAHDTIDRDRLSVEHKFQDLNAPWVQRAQTQVYWQNAHVKEFTFEDRSSPFADRTRDNRYTTDVLGLSSLLESNFSAGLPQRLSYGLDWSATKLTGLRDGTVPSSGDTFPAKPFPDTRSTQTGLFVQDEVEAGAVSLIPALRFDQYSIKPSTDGFGGSVASLSDQAVTPRFGVVWRLSPALAPYAQWARGFRAPTADQVNNGFTNVVQGYTSVGNPNLKSERAESFEIGVRGRLQDNQRYSASLFDNHYDNFISQQQVSGSFGNPSNPAVYQYINLNDARIHGGEVRTEWTVNPRWTTNAGLAWASGDSQANGVSTPLDTINPLKWVFGARYGAGNWGGRANLVHSNGKRADQVPTTSTCTNSAGSGTTCFAPSAYTVLDLGWWWKPQHDLTLNANLNNVFDTKYWRWSDVRGLADSSTVKDAYTSPGRSIQVSARYDF